MIRLLTTDHLSRNITLLTGSIPLLTRNITLGFFVWLSFPVFSQDFQCQDIEEVELQTEASFVSMQTFIMNGEPYFILGGSDGIFFTSRDGVVFDEHDLQGIHLFNGIVSNQEPNMMKKNTNGSPLYLLYGRNGPGQVFENGSIFSSTDFQSWNEQILIARTTPTTSGRIASVVRGLDDTDQEVWLAAGNEDTNPFATPYLFISNDGLSWEQIPFRDDFSVLTNLQYINGTFFGQGGSPHTGPFLARSEDGRNWIVQDFAFDITPIAYNPNTGLYLAGLLDGPNTRVMVSMDGINWNEQAQNNAPFLDITFTGTAFIASGGAIELSTGQLTGFISRSTDGMNWQIDEAPDMFFDSLAVKQTETNKTVLTIGFDEQFQSALARQSCTNINCPLTVSTTPSIQAQGLNPISITAIVACGQAPYSFTWRDEDEQVIGTTQSIQIPATLTQTTAFTITIQDILLNESEATAIILASDNPNLIDPNGDGINDMNDLIFVGSEWNTGSITFDADGDGRVSVLDLGFVSVE